MARGVRKCPAPRAVSGESHGGGGGCSPPLLAGRLPWTLAVAAEQAR